MKKEHAGVPGGLISRTSSSTVPRAGTSFMLRPDDDEIGPDRSLYAKDADRLAAIEAHRRRVGKRVAE